MNPTHEPPPVSLEPVPDNRPAYRLDGWDALDRWACNNSPLWRSVTARCRYTGISDTDYLKLLASELLRRNQDLQRQLYANPLNSPPTFIIPPPTNPL